jgi:hypothetical protein
MRLMMAMDFRMRLLLSVGLILSLLPFIEPSAGAAANALATGQELSRQADALIKDGHEQEAAKMYLAAHVQFQSIILAYFESALRESLGGPPADGDEEALMRAGSVVGDLRNVNLSKLWIVLDPEDRAYQQGLESERTLLLQQFDQFIQPESADLLEAFLFRLYPEDESGEHQMESVREGQMPPSKRWQRLQGTLSP